MRFTEEDFSDFQNGRLPTLDFALEVEAGKLEYCFFEKPMNSMWVTHSTAASSMENKQTWLTNDLVRRLLRISEDVFERSHLYSNTTSRPTQRPNWGEYE